MGGEPKICPLTNKFCKSSVCMWWVKWTDRDGLESQSCIINEFTDRLFEIAEEISRLQKDYDRG